VHSCELTDFHFLCYDEVTMKRFVLPLIAVSFVLLGVALVFRTIHPWHPIQGGKIRTNPLTQETTIYVHSRFAVINATELDLSKVRFVRAHPEGKILIRITGGVPTRVEDLTRDGAFPDGIYIINPAGVIVGEGCLAGPGGIIVLDDSFAGPSGKIDLDKVGLGRRSLPEFSSPIGILPGDTVFDEFGQVPRGSNEAMSMPVSASQGDSVVELKAHGNVYSLAIRREGKIRATRVRSEGSGRIPSVEPAKPE